VRLPYADYHRLDLPRPERLHTGLDGFIHALGGRLQRGRRRAAPLAARAARIDALVEACAALSEAELSARLADHAATSRRRPDAEVTDAAWALVVEAARRSQGLRAYVEQIMGALGSAEGLVIEMETGSGKSLTAALAAVPLAWSGRPTHLLTVNDYLAERDAARFRPFFARCGLSVGVVTAEQEESVRRDNHHQDITYTTAKELLADFLRDRLLAGLVQSGARRQVRRTLGTLREGREAVLRGIDQVIIDEADSILIDEAVSPLQIQAERASELLGEVVPQATRLCDALSEGRDYTADARLRRITFTSAGRQRVAALTDTLPPFWQAPARREELLRQALSARAFFRRDEHYVIHEEKVVIVDESTGRMMPGRSWSHGMHQAVEAKEGVPLSPAREVRARLSYQRFFRLFRHVGGMTGTAREAAAELWRVYRLAVVPIPSHWPSRREVWPVRACADAESKWAAIEAEVLQLHAAGRPVLVGTRSVADSERLFARLQGRGLQVALLNARHHREEAAIIADAGETGRITIATNMAGRGTDIRLGPGVAQRGGLHVIMSEPYEAGRIDRQLIGRCARQGDPGSFRCFLAADDLLIRRYLPGFAGTLLAGRQALAARLAQRRAEAAAAKARVQVLAHDLKQDDALLFASRRGEV